MNAAEGLSEEDLKLIAALLSSSTVRGAAESAGVSESTVYRRLRDPDFRHELKEQRLRLYSHALTRLQAAAEGAVEVLESTMHRSDVPPALRIKAAVHVLELADKGPQPEMLDRRLQNSTEALLEDLA